METNNVKSLPLVKLFMEGERAHTTLTALPALAAIGLCVCLCAATTFTLALLGTKVMLFKSFTSLLSTPLIMTFSVTITGSFLFSLTGGCAFVVCYKIHRYPDNVVINESALKANLLSDEQSFTLGSESSVTSSAASNIRKTRKDWVHDPLINLDDYKKFIKAHAPKAVLKLLSLNAAHMQENNLVFVAIASEAYSTKILETAPHHKPNIEKADDDNELAKPFAQFFNKSTPKSTPVKELHDIFKDNYVFYSATKDQPPQIHTEALSMVFDTTLYIRKYGNPTFVTDIDYFKAE